MKISIVIPPTNKRKDDGPACRVCGCTKNNACLIDVPVSIAMRMQTATKMGTPIGCSWVPIERGDEPLCSACAGTEDDMAQAIKRGCDLLQAGGKINIANALKVGRAALLRRQQRELAS